MIRKTGRPLGIAVLLLAFGCNGTGSPETNHASETDSNEAAGATADANAADMATPAAESRSGSAMTPELQAVFGAFDVISDTAASEFGAALQAASTAENRRALAKLAKGASTPLRQRAAFVLGEIGTDEEVEVLQSVAEERLPRGAGMSRRDQADNDANSELDDKHALRWSAVGALARMHKRGSASAENALERLLSSADEPIAQAAAIELFEQGRLTTRRASVLRSRGVFCNFARLDPRKTYELEAKIDSETAGNLPSSE